MQNNKVQIIESLSLEALAQVSGGTVSQEAALQALQKKYPGARIDMGTDLTASGRSPRTERGGWRAGIETSNNAFEAIVSPNGRAMRDPMGQGDL
jgi:hypothetical protein